ncbi:MAG TPA: hypothetical protein VKG25_29005 [Bryobacteraceae bacterium]|nr:hypothetical protein [Bryobacteraceae bacterium]
MDIVGEKKFIELPGERTHELPPLLVRDTADVRRLDRVMNLAGNIVESDDMLPDMPGDPLQAELEHDRRKMDLAVNLVDQYVGLIRHWQWGDSILEWIRQCEITFGARLELRNLLRPDVWPHAGRSSFVTLLADKAVKTSGVELHKAVGLRLTFRQPPPISCFSNQFLFYLNGTVASSAYDTWAHLSPDPVSCLPPERFTFDVVNMSVQ